MGDYDPFEYNRVPLFLAGGWGMALASLVTGGLSWIHRQQLKSMDSAVVLSVRS